MPASMDWTGLQPVVARYPAAPARDWSFHALDELGGHPRVPRPIAGLSHPQPAASLHGRVLGLSLDTPVAFSAELVGNEHRLAALSRLGAGLVEVGPAALDSAQAARFERAIDAQAIRVHAAGHLPARLLIEALRSAGPLAARVLARLAFRPGADAVAAAGERRALIAALAPHVDAFSLTPPPHAWDMWAWAAHIAQVQDAAQRHGRPVFAGVTVDDLALAESQLESAYAVGVRGLLICDGVDQTRDLDRSALNALFDHRARPAEGCLGTPALAAAPAPPPARLLGPSALALAQRLIRRLRARYGSEGVRIMAAAGATEPAHALELLQAGADVVGLAPDLVLSGAGSPFVSRSAALTAG